MLSTPSALPLEFLSDLRSCSTPSEGLNLKAINAISQQHDIDGVGFGNLVTCSGISSNILDRHPLDYSIDLRATSAQVP